MGTGKVRLSLELTPEMNNVLERLSEATGSNKSEILRKAINIMEVAVTAKEHGEKLGVVDKDDNLKTLIVGV